MVAGRSNEARAVASVGTTAASGALTGPAGSFNKADAGRPIAGTGIPAAATIASVASGTAATLSANATATGTITATIGTAAAAAVAALSYGLHGWSPETDSESQAYTLAAVNAGTPVPPSNLTNNYTGVSTLQRSRG